METIQVRLSTFESAQMVSRLGKLEHPVHFVISSPSKLKVFIDGEETAHELCLKVDGTWCIETCVPL